MKESILFKIVPIFIGFVFVLVIVSWIVIGIVGFKTVTAVDQHGLKGVLNYVWEGKDSK